MEALHEKGGEIYAVAYALHCQWTPSGLSDEGWANFKKTSYTQIHFILHKESRRENTNLEFLIPRTYHSRQIRLNQNISFFKYNEIAMLYLAKKNHT